MVHDGKGAVGATDLMRASHNEVVLMDLTADATLVASEIAALLEGFERLEDVSARAAARARSWDEQANARALADLIQQGKNKCTV